MSGSNAQSQRDASDVGIPCSICSSIDFLPFKCVYCQRVFCKEHSSQARPEEHACPVYSGSSNIVSNDGEQNRVVSGSFKDLLPDRTQKVQAPVLTAEELEKQNKKEAALALLRKNFPNTALTSATTTKTTKATLKPVSKTIVIMKLKQNAKALDPLRNEKQIPVKERRFFFARTSNNGYDNEGDRRSFWLPKNCSCGKALNLLTSALKVPNKNNVASTPASERLLLVTLDASDTMIVLPTGKSIESAISDGDEVMIARASEVNAQ